MHRYDDSEILVVCCDYFVYTKMLFSFKLTKNAIIIECFSS